MMELSADLLDRIVDWCDTKDFFPLVEIVFEVKALNRSLSDVLKFRDEHEDFQLNSNKEKSTMLLV